MHRKEIITAGKKLDEAEKVLILVHGRGGAADDILGLARSLHVKDYALVAPQATNNTWYPYSFLAPPPQNEPWLSSSLTILQEIVSDINRIGIADNNIYFAGFSQGACLTLEFVARNARRWAGVAAFTGGLIGDKVYEENYNGNFAGTPVFIGTSDPDPHVPVERVKATTQLFRRLQATVTEKVYVNMGHTINRDEIEKANALIFV